MGRFVGQEVVALMIVVALVVALQPSMGSSHHKKHGRLRNHATAASRTVRKLSALSTAGATGTAALGGQEREKGSMRSARARASPMERVDVGEDKTQWTSDDADQESQDRRSNTERSSINGDEVLHRSNEDAHASRRFERSSFNKDEALHRSIEDAHASRGFERSSINGHEALGRSIEDERATRGFKRESINGELGRVSSASKVNMGVHDQRKSAGLSTTFTRSKDIEGLRNIEAVAMPILEKEQMVKSFKEPALTIAHKQPN